MTEEKNKLNEGVRAIRWRMTHEEFRFADEFRIIPHGLIYLAIAVIIVAQIVGQIAHTFARGPWTNWDAAGIAAIAGVLIAVALLFFGYVNRYAKRRGMNSTLWTLIVIFVPYLIGLIIYFLVREPMPFNCPQCGATVSARFNFCPACKCNLRHACPQCKHEVRSGDKFCPNCAQELVPAAT